MPSLTMQFAWAGEVIHLNHALLQPLWSGFQGQHASLTCGCNCNCDCPHLELALWFRKHTVSCIGVMHVGFQVCMPLSARYLLSSVTPVTPLLSHAATP